MARLTNSQRDTLVRKILEDVPNVDYLPELETIVRDTAFGLLPPEIRALPKDVFNAFVEFDCFVGDHYHRIREASSMFLPSGKGSLFPLLKAELGLHARYNELIALAEAQDNMLADLRREIKSAVYSCATEKQLTERYPEFAKYLPKVAETVNLPTVPIVEHLKAAGWKGE